MGPPVQPSSLALFPLLLFLILGVGLCIAIVLFKRRSSRRGGRRDLSSCGHCGYAVTGLITFTCPECGSDLREVGIHRGRAAPPALVSSRPPSRFTVFARIVGWKLALFAALYIAAASYGIDYYPQWIRPTSWTEVETMEGRPRSGAYAGVTVKLTQQFTANGTARKAAPKVDRREVSVDIKVGPERFEFVRDVIAGTNTYRDSAGIEQKNARPVAAELRQWIGDHGVDVSRPAVGAEIDAIADAISQSDRKGAFWEQMVNRATSYFQRDMASTSGKAVGGGTGDYYNLAGSIAVIPGLAGLIVIWRRNRERLARALGNVKQSAPSAPAASPEGGAIEAPSSPIVRTLSVMFSDVKDYTARTARESRLGVLDLVRRHRDLAQPIIKRRGGRIVKLMGDGLLITYESATDAVLAGLEIQAAVANHNRATIVDREKVELRIAVSTGEVAVEAGDVFGETVNLASRAQQEAAPGDVLFTEATCATINRREVLFTEAGTFDFKGLPDPVRLYRALPAAQPPTPPERQIDGATV